MLKFSNLKAYILASLFLTAFQVSADDFVVDGCFQCGSETYTVGFEVSYYLQPGDTDTIATGYLYFGEEEVTLAGGGTETHQFMFFQIGEQFVDTVYHDDISDWGDDAAKEASGWFNTTTYTETKTDKDGKEKTKTHTKIGNGHTFKNLEGSDTFGTDKNDGEFILVNEGAALVVDLISPCSGAACDVGNDSGYQSEGITDKSSGDTSFVSKIRTSMDYNVLLDGFNTSDSLTVAEGWLTYVGYEFEFNSTIFGDLALLGTDNIASYLLLGASHASPSKFGIHTPDTEVTSECTNVPCGSTTTTNSVPEPSSLAIFALALMGFVGTRKKRS